MAGDEEKYARKQVRRCRQCGEVLAGAGLRCMRCGRQDVSAEMKEAWALGKRNIARKPLRKAAGKLIAVVFGLCWLAFCVGYVGVVVLKGPETWQEYELMGGFTNGLRYYLGDAVVLAVWLGGVWLFWEGLSMFGLGRGEAGEYPRKRGDPGAVRHTD